MPISGLPPYDEQNIFARILRGEIPSRKIYEDEWAFAFHDIDPQAPTHVLVVPKRHFRDLGELAADPARSAAVLAAIRAFTADNGLSDYRTVFNTGAQAGQSVFHVHAHLLAGRPMGWPPG